MDGKYIFSYAILPHTCEVWEVMFRDLKDYKDIEDVDTELEGGYQKTLFCAQQAKRGGLDYF